MADGQTEKPAVPPPMETPEGEKKPESTGTPPNAMDEATFQEETGKIRDELTDMQTRADTLAADLASKDAWTEEDLKTSSDLISEMRALEARANGLAAGTPEQETALATLKNNITNAIDTTKEAIHAEEQKERKADEKKAETGVDGNGKPNASADVPPSDMDFPTLMSGINNDLGIVNDVLLSVNTEDGWQPEELNKLSDLASVMPHLVEAVKALETKAATPEQKELAAEARKQFDNAEAKIKDLSEKAAESTKPQPEKTRMERVTEGLGKAIEKIVEFFGKLSEAISNALDKAGVNKKNMLKLFGGVPFIGDILRSKVQVDDIHAQIEKTFGKGKLLKTDKDSETSADLKKAFEAEPKPEGSTESFDQFVQKRIDAVKAAGKTDKITIEDLVNIKPVQTKPDEDKKSDPAKNEKLEKQLATLKDAKAVDEGSDTWRVDTDVGGGMSAVRFKKTAAGTWEWANGLSTYGEFSTTVAGLTPEQIQNRKNMNELAAKLDIPKNAPPPPAPEQYTGTPEQKAKLKTKINTMPGLNQNVHMLALANALRAMAIDGIPDTAAIQKNILNETTVNAALKNSLNEFFKYHSTKDPKSSQEALGIYLDGDNLKEGYIDNDELDNDILNGVNLANDPVGFVQALATFEIADGNESAATGWDLNSRAFTKIKTLKEKLTASLAEFTS